ELLADARAKVDATQLSLDAKRAFWLADVDRNIAIYGGGAGAPGSGDAETASAESGTSAD
ncbi:MAG: TolC family protein, partial [Mesorhizobium sp.]|nr:TolC family protein [Mesorhizobium sp.]